MTSRTGLAGICSVFVMKTSPWPSPSNSTMAFSCAVVRTNGRYGRKPAASCTCRTRYGLSFIAVAISFWKLPLPPSRVRLRISSRSALVSLRFFIFQFLLHHGNHVIQAQDFSLLRRGESRGFRPICGFHRDIPPHSHSSIPPLVSLAIQRASNRGWRTAPSFGKLLDADTAVALLGDLFSVVSTKFAAKSATRFRATGGRHRQRHRGVTVQKIRRDSSGSPIGDLHFE